MADGSIQVPARFGGGTWTPQKVERFKKAFYEFLSYIRIDSKETGGGTLLSEHIYYAQRRFLDAVWGALAKDIHDVKCLKSRQLGISTICKPLVLFWMGVHDGIRGGMIFDTDQHKEDARNDIEEMVEQIHEYAPKFGFPTIKGRNRYGLRLSNRSFLHFMSAGVKSSRSSGVLGRSAGLSLIWASEVCSWSNDEGVVSLRSSVAQENPDRLFLWESTARGPGMWKDMWEEARGDDLNQATVFIGFWAKETQRIHEDSPAFARYGADPPTEKEQERIDAVKRLYGYEVDREQLAWYRRFSDPTAKGETDAPDPQDGLIQQDQPFHEEESFILTGSTFFSNDRLNYTFNAHASKNYKAYKFTPATDFTSCHIDKARTWRESELKVWEEPKPNHVYTIACDPAFGHSEKNDTSAVEVFDCYADCLEQVAEYRSGSILPHQLAWVIWTLVGWYGTSSGQGVLVIIEINGPGEAVWREVGLTRNIVQNGYLRTAAREKGLENIFQNARQYIYGRSDSMNPGHNYHWKALALDTPLPTPTGWTYMGEVKSGDRLLDDSGTPCNVLLSTEVAYDRPCFRLTFDDGTTIDADADHLWPIDESYGEIQRSRIRSTIELGDGGQFIKMAEPLALPNVELPIHPYVLGVWLGDGHSANGRVTCHKDDIDELLRHLSSFGFVESGNRYIKNNSITFKIDGLAELLRDSNLLRNKHIPPEYLRGSFEQRLWLMQGLMDTDGSIDTQRQCSFSTSSGLLCDGFAELSRTLGIKAKFTKLKKTLCVNGEMVECADAYQFWFTAYADTQIFRLSRKRSRIGPPTTSSRFLRSRRYKIVAISQIPSVPVRCIAVDSPYRLYLAGRGMIPTHNTNSQLKVAAMERLRDYLHQNAIILRSADLITEMRDITRDGDTIEAEGHGKDDRTYTCAMAVRGYEEKLRRGLIARNATRQAAIAAARLSMTDQVALFNQYHLEAFFKTKSQARTLARVAQMRAQRGW